VDDAFSLATGVSSFVGNVKQGKVGAAILDGVGIVADAAALVLPIVPGGAGAAIKGVRAVDNAVDGVKAGKTVDNVADAGKTAKAAGKETVNTAESVGRSGKTIAKENGVTVKSYGTNDTHKPAHAHVKGGGKEVRVGANGKPLKGQPELSDKQRSVVDNNKKEIRKEVNQVGKENKKIEELNKK